MGVSTESLSRMLLFISTGGTIDKLYPRTISGYGFEFGPSAARKVISRIKPRPAFEFRIIEAFAVDSQDMTEQHRRQVWDIIRSCQIDRIIITHGTDTIIQTAAYLAARTREQEERHRTILDGVFSPRIFQGLRR